MLRYADLTYHEFVVWIVLQGEKPTNDSAKDVAPKSPRSPDATKPSTELSPRKEKAPAPPVPTPAPAQPSLASAPDSVIDEIVTQLVDDVICSETTMPSVPDVVLGTINEVIEEGDPPEPAPDYDDDVTNSAHETTVTSPGDVTTPQQLPNGQMKRDSPRSDSPTKPSSPTSIPNGSLAPERQSSADRTSTDLSTQVPTQPAVGGGGRYSKREKAAGDVTSQSKQKLNSQADGEKDSPFNRQVSFKLFIELNSFLNAG